MYIGLLRIEPEIEAKINAKHNITFDQVKDAIQWPAQAEAEWDDDPDYGRRLVAFGISAEGRPVIAYLVPLIPYWEDEDAADTWDIRTARFVE